jgi:hypothetical protein
MILFSQLEPAIGCELMEGQRGKCARETAQKRIIGRSGN